VISRGEGKEVPNNARRVQLLNINISANSIHTYYIIYYKIDLVLNVSVAADCMVYK